MAGSLSLAVVGAGHLGRFHAQQLHGLDPTEPRWIVDPITERAAALAAEVGAEVRADVSEILAEAGAVIIATPTETHHEIASAALAAGCHVLVEKPMTATVPQGEALVAQAEAAGLQLHVGHVERFNPIFVAARDRIGVPAFVESERLAPFVPRSIDVDVVLDLMIHDLDILLSLVPHDVEALDAVGVAVLTAREDIANARIRFTNGTVANLTASRVSQAKVRKIRFFGSEGYLSLDFLAREGRRAAIRADGAGAIDVPGAGRFRVEQEHLTSSPSNAIASEIGAFREAVGGDESPGVSGREALRVLRIASRIQENVRASLERFSGWPTPGS